MWGFRSATIRGKKLCPASPFSDKHLSDYTSTQKCDSEQSETRITLLSELVAFLIINKECTKECLSSRCSKLRKNGLESRASAP
jgi:hypothetical protein